MRSEIELWIDHHQVSARLVQRPWLRPVRMAHPVSATLSAHAQGWPDKEQLLSVCSSLLKPMGKANGIRVIVSDAYARYLVLPRPKGVRSRAELEAAIDVRFHASFGDGGEAGKAWILRTDSAPRAHHDLVCAVRRQVHEALTQVATTLKTPLLSVQPLWIWCAAQLEAARHPRHPDGHWLIVAQGKVITAGLFQAGRCLGVRSSQQFAAGESLDNILMREASLYAESGEVRQLYIFGKNLMQKRDDSSVEFASELSVVSAELPALWDHAGELG